MNRMKGVTSECCLTTSCTVVKTVNYPPYTKELVERESFWLDKLKHTGFVPELIDVYKNSITMSYCGEVLNSENMPNDFYKQLSDIKTQLLYHRCFYNDWKHDNILVLQNKIYLIDFGWTPMIKEDYTCGGYATSNLTRKVGGDFFLL